MQDGPLWGRSQRKPQRGAPGRGWLGPTSELPGSPFLPPSGSGLARQQGSHLASVFRALPPTVIIPCNGHRAPHFQRDNGLSCILRVQVLACLGSPRASPLFPDSCTGGRGPIPGYRDCPHLIALYPPCSPCLYGPGDCDLGSLRLSHCVHLWVSPGGSAGVITPPLSQGGLGRVWRTFLVLSQPAWGVVRVPPGSSRKGPEKPSDPVQGTPQPPGPPAELPSSEGHRAEGDHVTPLGDSLAPRGQEGTRVWADCPAIACHFLRSGHQLWPFCPVPSLDEGHRPQCDSLSLTVVAHRKMCFSPSFSEFSQCQSPQCRHPNMGTDRGTR